MKQKWTEVQENDAQIEELRNRIKVLKERENEERKAEEDQIQDKRLQRRYDEEKTTWNHEDWTLWKTLKKRLKEKVANKRKSSERKTKISKFEGTKLDWLRFWSKFETWNYFADITTVSKFSYLKKLVILKVRGLIDGLPFDVEEPEREKIYFESLK